MTTVEVLLITPFALFFLLATVQVLQALVVQSVVTSAARETARTIAVHYDAALARQCADDVISGTLPTGRANEAVVAEGASGTEIAASGINPGQPAKTSQAGQLSVSTELRQEKDYACNFDPALDVALYDDGNYCTAVVEYHIHTLCPALPKLMNGNASAWSRWINVKGQAVFRHEYETPASSG